MIIYREDQEFNVNELILRINNGSNKFDLIIASQPYRSRISAEKKVKRAAAKRKLRKIITPPKPTKN